MKVYKFKINGTDYAVEINSVEDNVAQVTVNNVSYTVEMEGSSTAKTPKLVQPAPIPVAAVASNTAPVKSAKPAVSAGAGAVRSPLPGVILSLAVKEGDHVKSGQRLLVLEAMKMENNIDADRDGIVKSISAHKGDSVLEGDVLLTIE